jgi:putative nucleotidyltransferase with HDIG domain
MTTGSGAGITREDALLLLRENLKNEKLVAHCIASEAIMRALAAKFGKDQDLWGIAGLLHDLDYEITGEDSASHGAVSAKMLEEKGVAAEIADVIKKHNAEGLGLSRSTLFEHALTCAESITGMIVATALVYPDKKISSVKVSSVTKRMKTPHFARAVSRERILECEKAGIPLDEFVGISIKAMAGIADQLGL